MKERIKHISKLFVIIVVVVFAGLWLYVADKHPDLGPIEVAVQSGELVNYVFEEYQWLFE